MIIYHESKSGFMRDVEMKTLVPKLTTLVSDRLKRPARSEVISWENSLNYMYIVMNDRDIPDDAGVAIEYAIPTSSKRIDFLITGYGDNDQRNAVIVELKQWSEINLVKDKQDIVETYLGGNVREVPHPSYQAWSYASLIKDFNQTVQEGKIQLFPCAYLHNYFPKDFQDPILDPHYADVLEKAPLYDAKGVQRLRNFIKSFVRKGDQQKTLYELDQGRIRPSKSLQDSLASMLAGNNEFTLIDEQKVVFERAISLAEKSHSDNRKRVFIVEGGPGTGKSVVAVNLLSELTNRGMVCHFISKNSAPRSVYRYKLKGHMKAHSIDNLFKGSGSYHMLNEKELDVAVVDEAHRLNEKSGFYSNEGENQIKEIINASGTSIFFIDEDQRVALADIGTIDEIKRYATEAGADIFVDELVSQFRCNGSEGYIAWLDDVLQIRETANPFFEFDYDFGVVDDPNEMLEWVRAKNENNKSRVIAGYCWEWPSKDRANTEYRDIQIPEHDFEMSWNLDNHIWAIDPYSVEQAGCIHTSQGLEFEYIGVIVGPDMRYEDGQIITDFNKRARTDYSIRGIKKLYKEKPEEALAIADRIIKNTYRTLMTRGMKGCRIYCTDQNLADYFRERLKASPYIYDQRDGYMMAADEANPSKEDDRY